MTVRGTRRLVVAVVATAVLATMVTPIQTASAHDYSRSPYYGWTFKTVYRGFCNASQVQTSCSYNRSLTTSWSAGATFGVSARVVNSSTSFTYGESTTVGVGFSVRVREGHCAYLVVQSRQRYARPHVYKARYTYVPTYSFPPTVKVHDKHLYKGRSTVFQGRKSYMPANTVEKPC